MPIKDVDGGLNWQGYDPRLFGDKLPQDQYATNRFYFGGSQVPTDLNAPKMSSNMTGQGIASATHGAFRPMLRSIKKLPNMR